MLEEGKIYIVKVNSCNVWLFKKYRGVLCADKQTGCSCALCLEDMDKKIPKDASIAFPWRIASDRGGANWEIIKTMIIQILCKNDREIVFYKLGDI